MANILCIPTDLANKLKLAAKNGEINIEELYNMKSSKERRSVFEKWVDPDTASFINTEFEKAMASDKVNALKKWAEKVFTPTEKKTKKYTDLLKKIDTVNDMGILNPDGEKSFYQDLVADKLGARITDEEARNIANRADEIQKIGVDLEKIGDPTNNPELQIKYLKAKREMENYIESLNPSGKLRVLTSTISRGNMLFRVGSVLVNINSNNIEGTVGGLVRRLEQRAVGGVNNSFIGDLVKHNVKVFNETGYDLTRAVDLDTGKKFLGEEIATSQGPGKIRKAGRWYEDVVFRKMQGLPDVIASSIAFGDRANIMSTKIARAEGLTGEAASKRALEIFKDASSISPATEQGMTVRNASIADAERSTNTDKRFLADRALKLRQVLNVGDLRFGDLNIPFVKTTANAIQSALQTSGVTVPIEAVADTVKMVKLVREGSKWGDASKEAFSKFGETATRAGIGLVAASLIAMAIDPDKYMGVYPTSQKERELMELENATPNSIKIGNKWISLDWFGPLGAAIVGMLNAKKYGKDLPTSAYNYALGAGYQITKVPGLDYLRQSLDSLQKTLTAAKGGSIPDAGKAIANYLVDFAQSRFIPGFITQLSQLTDNVVRETSHKQGILAPLQALIPGLRQQLPPNRNIFGETTPTEGWNTIIWGSRVKTGKEDKVVNELVRLRDAGQLPSITDVSKTSERAKDLKEQIGQEKFDKFLVEFGGRFKSELTSLVDNPSYKNLSDEQKKSKIENIKSKLFDGYLSKFGYKKPTKVSSLGPDKNFVKDFISKIGDVLSPDALAAETGVKLTQNEYNRIQGINKEIETINKTIKLTEDARSKGMVSPVDTDSLKKDVEKLIKEGEDIINPPVKQNKPTETPYNKNIKEIFGKNWIDATRVLKRVNAKGEVVGENTQLKTGKEIDFTNRDGTIDRGLFRINSYTFNTIQDQPYWKKRMMDAGITSWDDMLNPVKNIKMARIIFDQRSMTKGSKGWDPWIAAPKELLSEKEIARRKAKNKPIFTSSTGTKTNSA